MRKRLTILGFMLLSATAQIAAAQVAPVRADDAKIGDITIHQPWSRATANGAQTGAVYFEIRNAGAADRLVEASTPVAGMAQLHTTEMQGDMASMKMMQVIDLPAGATVVLKPQSMHLMLMDLKQTLHKGDSFPLKLQFEKAGTVDLQVKVESAGALAPDGI
ncbi:MAG: copper chaperone PCu(A)C [Dongiaceae bacterium]